MTSQCDTPRAVGPPYSVSRNSEQTRGLTRRAAVTGLAAAPLAAMPAVAVAGDHPDAELLTLGRQWQLAWEAMDALNRLPLDEFTDDDVDRACGRMHVLEDAIFAVPAKTAEGIVAKAQIVAHYDNIGLIAVGEAKALWDECRAHFGSSAAEAGA